MTPRERVCGALTGQALDRPPISFWGHVYDRETIEHDLAEIAAQLKPEPPRNWLKLKPRKHYHVEDWGVRYRYFDSATEKPLLESWPVQTPEDWGEITRRPPDQGALGEQVDAVRLLRDRLPRDVPFVETVFTPLAVL